MIDSGFRIYLKKDIGVTRNILKKKRLCFPNWKDIGGINVNVS